MRRLPSSKSAIGLPCVSCYGYRMGHAEPSDDELKAYAAGRLGWADLRNRGVNYAEILFGLGRLGLRPPIAPLEGPNLAARQRGIARLKDLLGPSER